ncbi:MAG: hypothetical protein INF98_09750, partial [Roseomonas sp.]|nr:hypothetical protein [Roseomonas sp.]
FRSLPAHALDALGMDPDQGLSGRITETALRYRALLDAAVPDLTESQWCAICDALNGYWLVMESSDRWSDPVLSAWANVQDAEADGLGEKWNVDVGGLAHLLGAMPYVQQAAVCDVVRRFWKHPKLNDLPTAELLRQAGAHLAD